MLGLQLSVAQVMAIGFPGLLQLVGIVCGTILFCRWCGRRLGVGPPLTDLIAAGTAICGASAVSAMNTVTAASDEDAAYAVASVTIFGTIAMFVYPALFHLLSLSDMQYGFWAGASIHEVAQVAAAAFQVDATAGNVATVVKLSRVMMLAPLVLAIGALTFRQTSHPLAPQTLPVPWFVVGFACCVALNSSIEISPDVRTCLMTITTGLLSMALAWTRPRDLRPKAESAGSAAAGAGSREHTLHRSFELCRDQARVLTKADTSRGLLNLRLNTITKGET